MPIIDQEGWQKCQDNNTDPYGNAAVKVARRVMEILDEEPGDFDTHETVCRADKESGAGGITGFMAGCVASIVSQCHSRGEEFRKKWNKDYDMKEIRVWFEEGEQMHITEARSALKDLGLEGLEVKKMTLSDKDHRKLMRVNEEYWEMVHLMRNRSVTIRTEEKK
jgi:hypothetical protein